MTSYKTTDYAIGVVYGLLSSITVPKYRQTKPTPKASDAVIPEYVVINALPINMDVMQKCIVNVNYHVKDIAPGVKDTTKIEAGSAAVMAILNEVLTATYQIDIESQETFREEKLGEHFSNMRFSFKLINN
jgi:hypothetical protein